MFAMTSTINSTINDPDPWSLANANTYDIDKFYCRSTDGKGHYRNIQVPLSPALMGEIQALVASQVISSYRTLQDFIRDACIHRAKYVAELVKSGVLGKVIDSEIMLAEVARRRVEREGYQKVIEEYKEEVDKCLLAGDKTRVHDLIADMVVFVEHMPPPYNSHLDELIKATERKVG
jgi:hypothetical protein